MPLLLAFSQGHGESPSRHSSRWITIAPPGNRCGTCRKHLQRGKRRVLPHARTQQDRNDERLVGLVSLQRLPHVGPITRVRGQNIAPDQQQDQRRGVHMTIQFPSPDAPRRDLALVPGENHPLALECAQMVFQLLQQGSVRRGIRTGIQDFNGCALRLHACRVTPSPSRETFSSTSIALFCSGCKCLIFLACCSFHPLLAQKKGLPTHIAQCKKRSYNGQLIHTIRRQVLLYKAISASLFLVQHLCPKTLPAFFKLCREYPLAHGFRLHCHHADRIMNGEKRRSYMTARAYYGFMTSCLAFRLPNELWHRTG